MAADQESPETSSSSSLVVQALLAERDALTEELEAAQAELRTFAGASPFALQQSSMPCKPRRASHSASQTR